LAWSDGTGVREMKLSALKSTIRASAAASLLAISGMAIGTLALTVGPGFAQDATITADQATAIQNQLQAAIAAVNAQGLTGAAYTSAVEAAIAQVTSNAVATDGAAAAASIASAVLAAPSVASLPPATIGAALGAAAATVATNEGVAAATAIGVAVANEAPTGSATAFSSTVVADGGPAAVARAGTAAPIVTGSTQNGQGQGQNQNGQGQNNNTNNNTGCQNPSCS
jgi:hypothetical protein